MQLKLMGDVYIQDLEAMGGKCTELFVMKTDKKDRLSHCFLQLESEECYADVLYFRRGGGIVISTYDLYHRENICYCSLEELFWRKREDRLWDNDIETEGKDLREIFDGLHPYVRDSLMFLYHVLNLGAFCFYVVQSFMLFTDHNVTHAGLAMASLVLSIFLAKWIRPLIRQIGVKKPVKV